MVNRSKKIRAVEKKIVREDLKIKALRRVSRKRKKKKQLVSKPAGVRVKFVQHLCQLLQPSGYMTADQNE